MKYTDTQNLKTLACSMADNIISLKRLIINWDASGIHYIPSRWNKPFVRWSGILVSVFAIQACQADNNSSAIQQTEQGRSQSSRDVSLDPHDNYLANRQYFLNQTKGDITPEDINILNQGRDKHALMIVAMRIARSQSINDLKVLEAKLTEKDFLERLDDAEDYQGTYAGLRLAGVLGILMDNHYQYAGNIVVRLIDNAVFQAHLLRIQLLAHVLVHMRPAPTEVIGYWRKLSQPGSPLTYDVVETLCNNQSDSAMLLLESLFADPEQDDRSKLAWMRQLILPRRNDLAILQTAERLLKKSLPNKLRFALVEVLFDYLPAQWYIGINPPKPPKRTEISPEAEKVLRRIEDYALEQGFRL